MSRTGTPQRAAHNAVSKAICDGVLARPTECTICHSDGWVTRPANQYRQAYQTFTLRYHHWSYLPEHQLDVVPVCGLCHRRVHTGHLPEPKTGLIRAKDPGPWHRFNQWAAENPEAALELRAGRREWNRRCRAAGAVRTPDPAQDAWVRGFQACDLAKRAARGKIRLIGNPTPDPDPATASSRVEAGL